MTALTYITVVYTEIVSGTADTILTIQTHNSNTCWICLAAPFVTTACMDVSNALDVCCRFCSTACVMSPYHCGSCICACRKMVIPVGTNCY